MFPCSEVQTIDFPTMLAYRRQLWSVFRFRPVTAVLLLAVLGAMVGLLMYSFTETVHHDEKRKPVARFAKESSHPNIAPLPSDFKELQVPFVAESNRNIDHIYRKRREHLKYICNVEHLRSQTREKRTEQLSHYKSLNILYCPLENHDTVIWRKTFEIWMRSQTSTRSSFDLDWRQFSRSKYKFPTLKETELQTEAFMTLYNSSLKVIYTRDPHWQLFEYYVNNFVVPSNESLQLGKQITLNHKDSRTKEDLKCGHSVTFKEFTNYLRSTNQYSSFAGTANHCDVCGIDFDVIGKEDTFEQDTLYVYNKLNSPDKVSAFEDFQREYDFSIIEGFVETAFTRKNNITCISTYSMYLRLWRQLQIWGYISNNITFPYTKEESLTLAYTKLLDATLMAYHNSVPMSRSNRFEAIGQAYFDLTLGDLGSVRKPFELDFHLFGYPDRPALVYFKQGPRSDFSYLDIVAHQG